MIRYVGLISAFFVTVLSVFLVHSQTDIQILCDTTSENGQTVQELPHTIYRVVQTNDGTPVQQIERITQTSAEILDIPLSPELLGRVYPHRVSPDGRYLSLIGTEADAPFAVWKIGTSEIATLLLSPDDTEYLRKFVLPTRRQEAIITWTDNSNLLIRYFDLDYDTYDHTIAEKTLTIVDDPLQIVEGTRIAISYPNLTPPDPSSFPRPVFSPQGTYVTLVTSYVRQRFQIYDTNQAQLPLVADLQPDSTRQFFYRPIWTSDEDEFFVMYRINPGTSPVRFGVSQVHVNQGFQFDNSLQSALEATFGADMTVGIPSLSLMNGAGTDFVFRIYVPAERTEYLVIYETDTGNIKAICDAGSVMPETYYPVWGPNQNHFGYWNNGSLVAYDLATGQGYRIDGRGFIGWIDTSASCDPNTNPACSPTE